MEASHTLWTGGPTVASCFPAGYQHVVGDAWHQQQLNYPMQSPEGSPTQLVGAATNTSSRYGLDANLLPSAVQVMQQDQAEWQGKVFVSEPDGSMPPLATTGCTVQDEGNASPRFIRCTTYSFPRDGAAAQQCHVPLGAIVSPLARLGKQEAPLPVCSDPVPGCGTCGALMCPYMAWQDCGQRFCCPFCGTLTEVPWQHYQPADSKGQRTDRHRRPELSLGSYEVLEKNAHQAAALLLAVDISTPSLRQGQLDCLCQQLCSFLTSLPGDSDLRVGLITYDTSIHLFDFSSSLSRPHMLVVTETDDLELPLREGLLSPLRDCREGLHGVLQQLQHLAAGSAPSAAHPQLPIQAGLKVLQTVGCPGKLLVLHSAPLSEPTTSNTTSGVFRSSKPKSLFQPPESSVPLAQECVRDGCSVELFMLSQQDVGGAWPGHIPYLTGGAVHHYSSLQSEVDRQSLRRDLRACVEADMGYKAELKVYISKGLRVSKCYGAFTPAPDPARVPLAAVDWRTTVAVEFCHRGVLGGDGDVVIQAVMSYTGVSGERRSRVHSLALPCQKHLIDTYHHCQAHSLLTFYCKKMYSAALERSLQELREELQTEVTQALACYRKLCTTETATPGQLVLPQFLKALPVYANSLRKSEVLLPGARGSVAQRLQLHNRLLGMDTRGTATHFYPLLLQLPVCAAGAVEPVRCSSNFMQPSNLYLAHCALTLVLWVGRSVPHMALEQLFGTSCPSQLTYAQVGLPVLDTPLSIRVRMLINDLQSHAPYSLRLTVVEQGDPSEEALKPLLVEDKSPNGGASYADFLYHLHVNLLRLLL